MDESTFRSTVREAVGEARVPAYLATHVRQAVRHSAERPAPRSQATIAAFAAMLIALAIVVALLAPRLSQQVQGPVVGASPSASPAVVSPTPDPDACRLPVVVDNKVGQVTTLTAGFLDVKSGRVTSDPNVTFGDLPHIRPTLPPGTQLHGPAELIDTYYDPAVGRWLPASFVSPDRLSYAYTVRGSKTEVHVYDLARRKDRIVWTTTLAVYPLRWEPEGIYMTTLPVGFPDSRYWRIDTSTSQVLAVDEAAADPYAHVLDVPGTHAVTSSDPEKALFNVGGRNPGTRYTDFVIVNSTRTDIYSGVNGDGMDFDPVNVQFDGRRLWFSNYDDRYLWSWTAQSGLKRYVVHIPGTPSGSRSSLTYMVAGPCLPSA
ncbi:MAG TPA: hypothetical protein VJT78_12420 [Candidatus Dormibacteraeota bacterium]|nr:hypothetical protein [Candidatus Dormibacteraeota bacterium]